MRRTDLTVGVAIGDTSFEKEQQSLVAQDLYVRLCGVWVCLCLRRRGGGGGGGVLVC